jgi:hypothetical protein
LKKKKERSFRFLTRERVHFFYNSAQLYGSCCYSNVVNVVVKEEEVVKREREMKALFFTPPLLFRLR